MPRSSYNRERGIKMFGFGYDPVIGGILIGSAPDLNTDWSDICDTIVLCAREYQPDPDLFADVQILNCPLHDDLVPLSHDEMQLIDSVVSECVRQMNDGRRILFTCIAGMNRSSFICGLTLIRSGMDPKVVIPLIRKARGIMALSNVYFRDTLLDGGL